MKVAFFSRNTNFCKLIVDELRSRHKLKMWMDNPNEQIRWASILKLLDWCDVAYLEWIQPPNLEISQIQGLDKPLVAFCHGVDVMNHSLVDWRNISGLITQDALYPRLQLLRAAWKQANPDRPPLPKLPKKTLIKSLGVDLRSFSPLIKPIPEYHIVTHATFIRPTKRIYTAMQQLYDLIQLDGEKPWKMTLIGQWEGGWKAAERSEYLIACRELIDQLRFPSGRLFLKYENFPLNIWTQFAKTADLYWCCSWRESFGASMAEVAASGGYPLINWYLGADKVYPKKYLCKTPGEMVRKTIEWGNLSQDQKVQEREIIRRHIEQYDARLAARAIRQFVEEVAEGYRK